MHLRDLMQVHRHISECWHEQPHQPPPLAGLPLLLGRNVHHRHSNAQPCLLPLPSASSAQVLEHPQADVAACPLENNLFVWHANLRQPESEVATAKGPWGLAGVPIHAVLIFPPTYPSEGPEVRLFHPLPHPNVSAHFAPPE